MRYLICYDTPDNRRRRRFFRLLQTLGLPLQLSLFECHLSPALRQQLIREVTPLLAEGEDRFSLYPICQRCWQKGKRAGIHQPEYQPPTMVI